MSKITDIIQDRIQVHGAYKRLFDTEDGRIVLRHIMKTGFVTSSTFVAGDSHQTAMNEGTRRLALSILKFTTKNTRQLIDQVEQELKDA